jgi:nucleoside-diphosphate-sugar epimerase
VSLVEVTRALIDVAGSGRCRVVPFPGERRAIDIGSFYSDDTKIRRVLGWEPHTPLEEGLRHTIEYFRAHGQHYL